MTDSFVTQCPQCRTRFRVSRAQLGAAHGAVRCGACLHVFNAVQQLLGELGDAAAPAPPLMPAPPPVPALPATAPMPLASQDTAKKTGETLWIHDDLDLDSLDLDEELAKLEQQEQQFSQEFLALEQAPRVVDSFLTPRLQPRDPHDEGWAEALLKDDPPAYAPSRPAAGLFGTAAAHFAPNESSSVHSESVPAQADDSTQPHAMNPQAQPDTP
ncbi:MAG: MJ0042-type zinc finger domain-containing protein, partial [Pseudomonadota bacterium]